MAGLSDFSDGGVSTEMADDVLGGMTTDDVEDTATEGT
jgi:hypothetical protein